MAKQIGLLQVNALIILLNGTTKRNFYKLNLRSGLLLTQHKSTSASFLNILSRRRGLDVSLKSLTLQNRNNRTPWVTFSILRWCYNYITFYISIGQDTGILNRLWLLLIHSQGSYQLALAGEYTLRFRKQFLNVNFY